MPDKTIRPISTAPIEPHFIKGRTVILKNRTGADLFGELIAPRGSAWVVRYLDGVKEDVAVLSTGVLEPLGERFGEPLTLDPGWLEEQRRYTPPDPKVQLRRQRVGVGTKLKKRLASMSLAEIEMLCELFNS